MRARSWRALAVYTRYPRAFASELPDSAEPGFFALLVPAWDESSVIASMLRATLGRLDYSNYRIFVGHYRNDPATAAAIASVKDARIENVVVEADGPTTKADCLNHLYDALIAYETGDRLLGQGGRAPRRRGRRPPARAQDLRPA